MLEQKKWFVAVVAYNTELSVAEKLKGVCETFVPVRKVVSVWKDGRRKVRDKVLISGKVFVYCTEAQRLALCGYSFIHRFLVDVSSSANEFGRRRVAVVPVEQIERLRFVVGATDVNVDFDSVDLKAGESVRVVRGALRGLEGVVMDLSGSTTRFFIKIEHLGCAVVELNRSDIERL